MVADKVKGEGTREHSWVLKTPPGSSEFTAFRDKALDSPVLVLAEGKPTWAAAGGLDLIL